jgi:hypothetical protein
LAKSGVEPFNEGGIDAATNPLTVINEGLNRLGTTLDNPSLNGELASLTPFHNLDNRQIRPGNLAGRALFAAVNFGAKRQTKGFDVAGQSINGYQQRLALSNLDHLVSQSPNKGLVSMRTDRASNPQSR